MFINGQNTNQFGYAPNNLWTTGFNPYQDSTLGRGIPEYAGMNTLGIQPIQPVQPIQPIQTFTPSTTLANTQTGLQSSYMPSYAPMTQTPFTPDAQMGAFNRGYNGIANQNAGLAKMQYQPNALDWGQFALQGIGTIWSMFNSHKQLKLAEKSFNEMRALNRANYRNSAKAMNAQYRDQASGRGYVGMTRAAKRDLGRHYDRRKVEETY